MLRHSAELVRSSAWLGIAAIEDLTTVVLRTVKTLIRERRVEDARLGGVVESAEVQTLENVRYETS
jgi:hypothetical protein